MSVPSRASSHECAACVRVRVRACMCKCMCCSVHVLHVYINILYISTTWMYVAWM